MAKSKDVRAKSKDVRAKGKDVRAKGKDVRAKGKNVRAKGKNVRAKGKNVRAKGKNVRAKAKDVRVIVILECASCARNDVNKESPRISKYLTQKNRHNTPDQLELRKFCRYCHKHTIHGEIKK